MGLFDELKRFINRETEDAKEMLSDGLDAGNAALDKAARKLSADPNERLQATLEDIEADEDSFTEIREKAEGTTAAADATAEVEGEEPVFADAQDQVSDEPPPPPLEPPALSGAGGAMARLWVRVDTAAQAGAAEGTHMIHIDPTVERVVGAEWFASGFTDKVATHPEIETAEWDEDGHLVVTTSSVGSATVRLLVAGVLAPRIGEDWQSKIT